MMYYVDYQIYYIFIKKAMLKQIGNICQTQVLQFLLCSLARQKNPRRHSQLKRVTFFNAKKEFDKGLSNPMRITGLQLDNPNTLIM